MESSGKNIRENGMEKIRSDHTSKIYKVNLAYKSIVGGLHAVVQYLKVTYAIPRDRIACGGVAPVSCHS